MFSHCRAENNYLGALRCWVSFIMIPEVTISKENIFKNTSQTLSRILPVDTNIQATEEGLRNLHWWCSRGPLLPALKVSHFQHLLVMLTSKAYLVLENAKAITNKQIVARLSLSYLTALELHRKNCAINTCTLPSCLTTFLIRAVFPIGVQSSWRKTENFNNSNCPKIYNYTSF